MTASANTNIKDEVLKILIEKKARLGLNKEFYQLLLENRGLYTRSRLNILSRPICQNVCLQYSSQARCDNYETYLAGIPPIDNTQIPFNNMDQRILLNRSCEFPNTSNCLYKEQPKDAPYNFFALKNSSSIDNDSIVPLCYLSDAEKLIQLRHCQTSPLYTTDAAGSAVCDMLHKFCVFLKMRHSAALDITEMHICGVNNIQHLNTLYLYCVKKQIGFSVFKEWLPSYMMSYTKSVPDIQYNSPNIDEELQCIAEHYDMATGILNTATIQMESKRFIYNDNDIHGPNYVFDDMTSHSYGRHIKKFNNNNSSSKNKKHCNNKSNRGGIYNVIEQDDHYSDYKTSQHLENCESIFMHKDKKSLVTMKTLSDVANVMCLYHNITGKLSRLHVYNSICNDPTYILNMLTVEYMCQSSVRWPNVFIRLTQLTATTNCGEDCSAKNSIEDTTIEDNYDNDDNNDDYIPTEDDASPLNNYYNLYSTLKRWRHHNVNIQNTLIINALIYLTRFSIAGIKNNLISNSKNCGKEDQNYLQYMGQVGNIFVSVYNNASLSNGSSVCMFLNQASFNPLTAISYIKSNVINNTDCNNIKRRYFQFAELVWKHDIDLYNQLDRVFRFNSHLMTPYDIDIFNVMRQFYYRTTYTDSSSRNKIFRIFDMHEETKQYKQSLNGNDQSVSLNWFPTVGSEESIPQTLFRDFIYALTDPTSSGFMHMNRFFIECFIFSLTCLGGPYKRVPIKVVYGIPSLGKSNILSYIHNLFMGCNGPLLNVLERFSAQAFSAQDVPKEGQQKYGDPSIGLATYVHEATSIRGDASNAVKNNRSSSGSNKTTATTTNNNRKKKKINNNIDTDTDGNEPYTTDGLKQKTLVTQNFDSGTTDGSSLVNIFSVKSVIVDQFKLIYDKGLYTVVRCATVKPNDTSIYQKVEQDITHGNGYVLVFNQHYRAILDSSFYERVSTCNSCAVKQECESRGETFSVSGVDQRAIDLLQRLLYNFLWLSKLKNLSLGPSYINATSGTGVNQRLDWYNSKDLKKMVHANFRHFKLTDRKLHNALVQIDTIANLNAVITKNQIHTFFEEGPEEYNELLKSQQESLMNVMLTPLESRQLFAIKQCLLPFSIVISMSLSNPHYTIEDVRVYALEQSLLSDIKKFVLPNFHFLGDLHSNFNNVHDNPLPFFGKLNTNVCKHDGLVSAYCRVLTTKDRIVDYVSKGCWLSTNTQLGFTGEKMDFIQTTNTYGHDSLFYNYDDDGNVTKHACCSDGSGVISETKDLTSRYVNSLRVTPYYSPHSNVCVQENERINSLVSDIDKYFRETAKSMPLSPHEYYYYVIRNHISLSIARPNRINKTYVNQLLSNDMLQTYNLEGLNHLYAFDVNVCHIAHINLVTQCNKTIQIFERYLAPVLLKEKVVQNSSITPFRIVKTFEEFQYACFYFEDLDVLKDLRSEIGIYEYLPLRPNGRPYEIHPLCYPDITTSRKMDPKQSVQSVMFIDNYVLIYLYFPSFLYTMFNYFSLATCDNVNRDGGSNIDSNGYVIQTQGVYMSELIGALKCDLYVDINKLTPHSLFGHCRYDIKDTNNWFRRRQCGDNKYYVPISRDMLCAETLQTSKIHKIMNFGYIVDETTYNLLHQSVHIKNMVNGLIANGYRIIDNNTDNIHIACINAFDFNNPITCPEYHEALLTYRKSNMYGWSPNEGSIMFLKSIFLNPIINGQQYETERNARCSFIYLQNLFDSGCYGYIDTNRIIHKYNYTVGCSLIGTHTNTKLTSCVKDKILNLGNKLSIGLNAIDTFKSDKRVASSGEDIFKTDIFTASQNQTASARKGLVSLRDVYYLESIVCLKKNNNFAQVNKSILYEDTVTLDVPVSSSQPLRGSYKNNINSKKRKKKDDNTESSKNKKKRDIETDSNSGSSNSIPGFMQCITENFLNE